MRRSILMHYLISIGLSLLVPLFFNLLDKLFPSVGYGLLTFVYVFILFALVTYSYFTTRFPFNWTALLLS
jgi:hypothetical protein